MTAAVSDVELRGVEKNGPRHLPPEIPIPPGFAFDVKIPTMRKRRVETTEILHGGDMPERVPEIVIAEFQDSATATSA